MASLPASDRGFRYGMAVFETLLVRHGGVQFLAEHLQRGLSACVASHFAVDESWFSRAGIFLRNALTSERSGVARIHVTAGDGSPFDPAARCRMLLSYESRPPITDAVFDRGYRLKVCPQPFAPTLGGRKTHNYWPNIAALQAARAAGADEGLVFDPADQLVSACMANVFVVLHDGEVVTPPLTSGARDGVIRAWVMQQRNVRERSVERSDLQRAREIFLTSSWLGVMPAGNLEDKPLVKRSVSVFLMSKYHC